MRKTAWGVFVKSLVPLLVVHFPKAGSHLFLLLLSLSRSLSLQQSSAARAAGPGVGGALPSAHPTGMEKPGVLGAFSSWTESTPNLFAKL